MSPREAIFKSWRYLLIVLALTLGIGTTGKIAFAGPPPTIPAVAAKAQKAGNPQLTSTATPPACGPAWRVVASPNATGSSSILLGTAAIADNDVWAVGATGEPAYGGQTLTEHWDGSQWSIVASPNVPSAVNRLMAVTAISSNDVWAVGDTEYQQGNQILVLHWDGTQWSIVPGPDQAIGTLYGIAAISSSDIWAVGSDSNHTLIIHWDGSAWHRMTSPNVGAFGDGLYGVAAISANDVWAVGLSNLTNGQPLTLHWDGITWSVVPNPTPSGEYTPNTLFAVDAIASNDVWAVGIERNNSYAHTLAEHWDGSQWSIVPSSDPDLGRDNELLGISVISANDAWAVGGGALDAPTITEHWDGSQWSVVPNPDPGTFVELLRAVDASPSGNVWTVGYSEDDAPSLAQTLVEQYSDPCITPTSTVTGTPATATPTATPTCIISWNVTSSPNTDPGNNYLNGVDVVSANDVWSVGYYTTTNGLQQTLVEHWEGNSWGIVPSPNSGAGNNRLTGVTAVAANDVWAVGYFLNSVGHAQTLTMHWDGSQWSIVASPNPSDTSYNILNAVTAIAANDVWAVGSYPYNTLTIHWDGTTWSVVPDPPSGVGFGTELRAVTAISSDDVWAVGDYDESGNPNTLTEHWDGSQWSVVSSPNPGDQYDDTLSAVVGVASNDVWAVGYYEHYGLDDEYIALAEHWDGTVWSVVPTNFAEHEAVSLSGITAIAEDNVWAVGYFATGEPNFPGETLTMRWNGSSWGVADSPNSGTGANRLNGVAAVSGNDIWAVGSYTSTGAEHTLVERFTDQCDTTTPTATATTVAPTATATSIITTATATATTIGASPTTTATGGPTGTATSSTVPTALPTGTATSTSTESVASTTATVAATMTAPPAGTSTAPAGTATSTPLNSSTSTPSATACTITFTDVPQDSTFYPYIECLACRGIISGYNDGTFRPNNQTTRGQIAKIVANSAQLAEDPGSQIFEDVAPGSTFYTYINRLSNRGFMGGYQCDATPMEPCIAPNDRPYFRPGNNATRGQISKIVSNTAGLGDTPVGQTFEDVPPDSTFYTWVERLASRGFMGGYPCGGPGEPCIAPNDRPYFRPGNNVTRGQASKIVANTFFPNCYTPSDR